MVVLLGVSPSKEKTTKLIFTRVGGASGLWLKSSAERGSPFFTLSQSTKVDSTIQNDPKMKSMKNHPVIILCVFSRRLIAVGTDSWYTRLMGEVGAGKSTVCLLFL